MDTFTVGDLRECTGELIRDAETDELSVECLGEAGIPIARYSAEELDAELAAIG